MTSLLLRFLVPVLALAGASQAQLAASLRLSKENYLSGEPVLATVTITNHAGQNLVFQGDANRPWLDFDVVNHSGNTSAPTGRGVFGSVTIKAGETVARQVNLAGLYQMGDVGNYSVSARVRMPGPNGEITMTNRALFGVSPGRPYWSQKVGTTGGRGKTREFRILNFSGDQKSQLYVQVLDGRTGLPVRTFSLGEVLLLRKPSVTVDNKQRMHVLFLVSPTAWVHTQVDTDGNVVGRQTHLRGPQGDPMLITAPNGIVSVGNSVLYDPKAAAEARAKFRKLSERPAITF